MYKRQGFNIDAGLATPLGDNWTLGVTGQNLVSRDLKTKETNGYRDTYQIRPLVTSGLSWTGGPFTAALDVDLTETKRFKSEESSQYAGIGGEYRVLDWLAPVSYTHLTLPTNSVWCRSRWSAYH